MLRLEYCFNASLYRLYWLRNSWTSFIYYIYMYMYLFQIICHSILSSETVEAVANHTLYECTCQNKELQRRTATSKCDDVRSKKKQISHLSTSENGIVTGRITDSIWLSGTQSGMEDSFSLPTLVWKILWEWRSKSHISQQYFDIPV